MSVAGLGQQVPRNGQDEGGRGDPETLGAAR